MKLGFIHSPSGKSNCGSDSMITTAVNYSWMTLPHWMTLVQCHVQKLYLYNNNAKKTTVSTVTESTCSLFSLREIQSTYTPLRFNYSYIPQILEYKVGLEYKPGV